MNLNTKENVEELFDFIYNVGCRANWINDDIFQSSFDKMLSFNPEEYYKKVFNYDAVKNCDVFNELHDNLYMVDINYPSKKRIIDYFSSVDLLLRELNISVHSELREINIKLNELERTIV